MVAAGEFQRLDGEAVSGDHYLAVYRRERRGIHLHVQQRIGEMARRKLLRSIRACSGRHCRGPGCYVGVVHFFSYLIWVVAGWKLAYGIVDSEIVAPASLPATSTASRSATIPATPHTRHPIKWMQQSVAPASTPSKTTLGGMFPSRCAQLQGIGHAESHWVEVIPRQVPIYLRPSRRSTLPYRRAALHRVDQNQIVHSINSAIRRVTRSVEIHNCATLGSTDACNCS